MITRLVAFACAVAAGISIAGPAGAEPREPEHLQVITVRVATAESTRGTIEAWTWNESSGRYVRTLGPIGAYVGSDGVGRASERTSRTPAGVFTVTEAFGRFRDPGTLLPYRRVGLSDWWVSDVRSAKYNTFQNCSPGARCGFDQSRSEQLGAVNAYGYSVVIDYNRAPVVRGAGSAFFLHVSEGKPTEGCVSIARRQLQSLLTWLRPDAAPLISIGIGEDAYAVLG